MKPRLSILLHAVSVRRGRHWALFDVSWDLEPGERWALLGHNGSGKTQLLKLLCGDVWPTPGPSRPQAGSGRKFRLGRREITLIEAKPRVAYVGSELQDKYARYGWNLKVRDLIATGLHRTDILLKAVTPGEGRAVAAMMRACGLMAHAEREFLGLSYGQKRLVLLARALVQRADWLLLDELYNGLDRTYRRRIDALLRAAQRRGQSWVATAHRAADIPAGTRQVLTLAAGRVVSRETFGRRTREALVRGAEEHESGSTRLAAQLAARSTKPAQRRAIAGTPPLVRLTAVDLYVEYRPVLRKVDWELHPGQHWAVFGANGAGKSSFLRLLYGDLSPALGGRIERRGVPRGRHIAEWKRHIGLVSAELQSDYAVNVPLRDLVASGRHSSIGLVDQASAADRRAARRWLEFFDLGHAAERLPRELSYGELRRALLARAMAAEPKLILLDEPMTGLDPRQRALLKRMLQRLMREVTLVIAVHHPEDLPLGMTHALHLHNRRAHVIEAQSAT